MPVTQVRAPDGSIVKVSHPEGASEQEIIAYAQKNYAPTAQPVAAPQAAEGRGSIADAMGQGVSLGFSDELAGLLGAIPAAISTGNGVVESYKGVRDAARGNYEGYREENPKTALAAELGGGLLTGGMGGGRALAGTAGRQMLGRAAATGAALGGASGAGYSQADTMGGLAKDTALGAAVGGAAGFALPAAGQGLNAIGRRTASMADDLGMRLTPGHRYNSPTLQKVEASLESFPLTAPAFTKMRDTNQKALNRAAAEAIGATGDDLSGDVLGAAKARIGAAFNSLTQGRQIPVDPQFSSEISAIRQQLASPLKSAKKGNKFLDALDEITSFGTITDKAYQDISSEIADELMSKGTKGVSKAALRTAKEKIDDLFERSMGPDELAAFRKAREQWRNLMNVSKATDSATGNVSGLKLANRLATKDEHGYVYGNNKSPLYQAARASKQYKDIVGDSGTASRMFMPMAINALSGAGGGALLGQDPLAGAAIGLLGGPALARMYLAGGRPLSGALLAGRAGVAPSALSGLLGSDR